ncbi:MAG TPA: 2-amino-4-hydroxy-6-hydroxymethyldihydropteridine diphosphokinase [candidate division Zixibacteria bacterium]|nr:2-amino-4-hydroxy-6-hydroxymethyldihydropteridine diphosphokinase [candidate division Zixibacteria bacterium]
MSSHRTTAYLLLGANLGERELTLERCLERLDELPDVSVITASAVYTSPAVDLEPEAPEFLNQALQVETALSANELLDVCEALEREFGRTLKGSLRSRTLDVDILLFGDSIIDSPRLRIPHPRITERGFALVPLLELAPGCADPRTNRLFVEALTPELRDTVRRLHTHA